MAFREPPVGYEGEGSHTAYQNELLTRIAELEAEVAQRDMVLREAIRYFYGSHNIGDDEVCAACEHWVDDFPRMVDAMLKAHAEEGSK
jgi:hypothetical protein